MDVVFNRKTEDWNDFQDTSDAAEAEKRNRRAFWISYAVSFAITFGTVMLILCAALR